MTLRRETFIRPRQQRDTRPQVTVILILANVVGFAALWFLLATGVLSWL